MKNPDLKMYDDEVWCHGTSAMQGGKFEETCSLVDMTTKKYPELLRLWACDNDLQEITVVSANIGFERTYSKRYRKESK